MTDMLSDYLIDLVVSMERVILLVSPLWSLAHGAAVAKGMVAGD